MSEVIAELIRLGLRHEAPGPTPGTRGLPVVAIGRPVTAQDVRSLDDERMSVVLADGNVRVALTVKDHVHHRHATQWVEREAPDLATCPIAEDPDGCRVHHRQRRAAVGGGPATPA